MVRKRTLIEIILQNRHKKRSNIITGISIVSFIIKLLYSNFESQVILFFTYTVFELKFNCNI